MNVVFFNDKKELIVPWKECPKIISHLSTYNADEMEMCSINMGMSNVKNDQRKFKGNALTLQSAGRS